GIASGAVAVIAAGFDLRVAVQYFHLAPYAPYYLFFHSVLIFAAVACVVLAFKRVAWPFFFGWGLHLLIDAFTHVTDGIRPFWPLNSWQLVGPVSYWDFAHGAAFVIALEIIALAAALWILWREHPERGFNRFFDKPIAWQKQKPQKKALRRRLRR
ncbi:hypothetical protein H0O03_04600, partial [Candidatus Micrarchaeota archaeon]|nr:hypothetical protein [Candidatus Micrarchaeota archaeon]